MNETSARCDEILVDGIKLEAEESPEEDPLQGFGENYDYDGSGKRPEEVEYKIEVNDDFNHEYDCNDDNQRQGSLKTVTR